MNPRPGDQGQADGENDVPVAGKYFLKYGFVLLDGLMPEQHHQSKSEYGSNTDA